MLSVLIYEPDDARRNAICQTLMRVPQAKSTLKIAFSTGSSVTFARMLDDAIGATLVILGLSLRPANNRGRCLEFGSTLARNNRDCYTVYDIYDLDDLSALLPQCARPAGILLGEYDDSRAVTCFERIIDDYISLTSDKPDDDAIQVESGTATYRLPYDQILYIEALNKKLTICTVRQSISVRQSMNSLADALPQYFLRCHRSYIVNMKYVVSTDYREMLLTLSDGSRLPIARSMKNAFHDQFTGKGGEKP